MAAHQSKIPPPEMLRCLTESLSLPFGHVFQSWILTWADETLPEALKGRKRKPEGEL